jgi:hypothetical protein
MTNRRRTDDGSTEINYQRVDRFIDSENGYYLKTREGTQGPFIDLASALNGLIKTAEQNKTPQYQMRELYQSICEKALSSC